MSSVHCPVHFTSQVQKLHTWSLSIYSPDAERNFFVLQILAPSPQYLNEPHRQSTVETVDSGIADDHSGGGASPSHVVVSNTPRLSLDSRLVPIRPQARFINGHRVVTR